MNAIDIALRIATAAHAGQLDRDGHPVILHPLTVGLMGHTDEEKIAGFLHDVVEDSDLTFDDLLREGIPTGIVNALRLLTHEKGTDYFEYVQNIIDSGNPIALQVKFNDLRHNFSRGKSYPDLQAKHGKALKWCRLPLIIALRLTFTMRRQAMALRSVFLPAAVSGALSISSRRCRV